MRVTLEDLLASKNPEEVQSILKSMRKSIPKNPMEGIVPGLNDALSTSDLDGVTDSELNAAKSMYEKQKLAQSIDDTLSAPRPYSTSKPITMNDWQMADPELGRDIQKTLSRGLDDTDGLNKALNSPKATENLVNRFHNKKLEDKILTNIQKSNIGTDASKIIDLDRYHPDGRLKVTPTTVSLKDALPSGNKITDMLKKYGAKALPLLEKLGISASTLALLAASKENWERPESDNFIDNKRDIIATMAPGVAGLAAGVGNPAGIAAGIGALSKVGVDSLMKYDRSRQFNNRNNLLADTNLINELPTSDQIAPSIPTSNDEQYETFKNVISKLESSGGKNFNHPTIEKGIHKGQQAIGTYALMPSTVDDILNTHFKKDDPLQKLKLLPWERKKAFIEANPQVEEKLAKPLMMQVLSKYDSPEKAAYAWYNGHNLKPESITDKKLASSDYVNKFKEKTSANRSPDSVGNLEPGKNLKQFEKGVAVLQDPNNDVSTPEVIAPEQNINQIEEQKEQIDSNLTPEQITQLENDTTTEETTSGEGSDSQSEQIKALENLMQGFTNASVANRARAEELANENRLVAGLGRAGATIGAGIAGLGSKSMVKAATEGFDALEKTADQPIKTYEALTAEEKKDKDSSYSNSFREFLRPSMKELGMNTAILDNMSAEQMAAVFPALTRMFDAKETRDARKETLKEKSELKKEEKNLDFLTTAATRTKGIVDAYSKTQAAAESIKNMTGKNPAEDVTILYNYISVLDPASTVREGEVKLASSIASLSGRLEVLKNSISKGDAVDEKTVNNIKAEVLRVAKTAEQSYNSRMSIWREQAKARGLDESSYKQFDPFYSEKISPTASNKIKVMSPDGKVSEITKEQYDRVNSALQKSGKQLKVLEQ